MAITEIDLTQDEVDARVRKENATGGVTGSLVLSSLATIVLAPSAIHSYWIDTTGKLYLRGTSLGGPFTESFTVPV